MKARVVVGNQEVEERRSESRLREITILLKEKMKQELGYP